MNSPCEPPIVLLPRNHRFFVLFVLFLKPVHHSSGGALLMHIWETAAPTAVDGVTTIPFSSPPSSPPLCPSRLALCRQQQRDARPNLHTRGWRCCKRPLSACHWHFYLFYSCDFSHFYIVTSLVLCIAVIIFVICPRTLRYLVFFFCFIQFFLLIQAIIFMHSVAIWIDFSLFLLS